MARADARAQAGDIVVWSATLDQSRPDWVGLLDADEASRYRSFRSDADRHRFLLGATLARAAVCWAFGGNVDDVILDRTCDRCGGPHGRVRATGSNAGLSISHSGDRVLVAVNPLGPVGVDIERIDESRDLVGVARRVMRGPEYEAWHALAKDARPRALTMCWARKEAALKYTGDGLRVPMRDLEVTTPDRPAALLSWSGRPDMTAEVGLTDLDIDPAYAACLAHPRQCRPRVWPAQRLLAPLGLLPHVRSRPGDTTVDAHHVRTSASGRRGVGPTGRRE